MMDLETLLIRIGKEQTRHQDQEVIRVLTEDDTEQLPFELPEFFDWPTGPQSVSRKGRLLMLAGMKYMKERYPKAANLNEALDGDRAMNQTKRDISPPPAPQWHQQESLQHARHSLHSKQDGEPSPFQGDRQLVQGQENGNEPRIDDELTEGNQARSAAKATYDISLFQ